MKITYAVPEEKSVQVAAAFLKKELAQARNIKDKKTRQSVIDGLNYIVSNIVPGCIYHTDGVACEFRRLPYKGVDTIYHCGKEFKFPEEQRKARYLLVAFDAQEATIGLLDGKRITTMWTETSDVPRKHNKGGQSKVRFQRNREESLKQWYKTIAGKIQTIFEQEGGK